MPRLATALLYALKDHGAPEIFGIPGDAFRRRVQGRPRAHGVSLNSLSDRFASSGIRQFADKQKQFRPRGTSPRVLRLMA
jgi:hypothetical protein